jgi:ubiquinone/menaquinone biosynthesis C-methylase UbiE
VIPRVLEPEYMDTVEEAESYDAMDHSAPNAAVVERLLELGATSGQALDIGTGPGHIPILLARSAPALRITAIDAAETMLAIAARRVAESGLGARIRLERADAKALRYSAGSFDVVFSNTILHHIPDPVAFLREAWRVLQPGGVLLIRDLCRPRDEAEVQRLVALHAAGATPRQQELLAASLHAALTLDEARAAARAAGMRGVSVEMSSDRHYTIEHERP